MAPNTIIGKLFSAKSPFKNFQEHMELVKQCMEKLRVALEECLLKDGNDCNKVFNEVSEIEFQADQLKNHIRDTLPRSVFLPVSRTIFLEVLSTQDSLPDIAEDIGALYTMKPNLKLPEELKPLLSKLIDKVYQTFNQISSVVANLDVFLETSFGKKEHEKFIKMISELGKLEHEADIIQMELLRQFFAMEDKFTAGELYLWLNIFRKIADIANASEKLGNRIRVMFAR